MATRAEINSWPVEYKNELLLGNLDRSLAICSLWSDKEYVTEKVGKENIAVVGNLYSHGPGIEGIIRNILANPAIRAVVIVGKDKSQSAETLLHFFKVGVEKTDLGWTIPLTKSIKKEDLPAGMRSIDKAIPYKAIESLRRNVEIIDLRGRDWKEVEMTVSSYKQKTAFSKPAVYPKTESKVEVMQGEDVGFVFRGEKPQEVWTEILRTIRQFGFQNESRYTSTTQELLNIVAVLDGDLEKMMSWPGWVGHSPEAVRNYSQQLINGVAVDKEDTYAYGERMRVRRGDQIAYLIDRLKKKPSDRGLLIDLWDVKTDFFGTPESPPCLTQAWFRVHQDKLYANFSYRSHDMYGAWIKNAMGDRLLQAYVAKETGFPLGKTTIISYSAHIYEHDFTQVDNLLKEQSLKWKFSEDPRGNFMISVEKGQIKVKHENRSGSITMLKGTSARDLYKEIWAKKLISLIDHAMYVGYELAEAERSIREGKNYIQDRA